MFNVMLEWRGGVVLGELVEFEVDADGGGDVYFFVDVGKGSIVESDVYNVQFGGEVLRV